ncbi:MAG TPA: helix-turn-helix domain-containing protein [Galbitalea sp.]
MTDQLPRMPRARQKLRADAEDNRERVLQAARELFSERGLDVHMREIARRAGVGPATAYRRFPTKQLLADAAFADELRSCAAIVAEGCADPDAWRGLSSVLMRIGEVNARNQGFVDAFMSMFPETIDFSAHRIGMLRSLAVLARRAKEAGELRDDFTIDDLVLILMAGRGLKAATPDLRAAAARRFSALAIDGLRTVGGPTDRFAQ